MFRKSKSPKIIRERSILAVLAEKSGQLTQPIRILVLTVKEFANHNIYIEIITDMLSKRRSSPERTEGKQILGAKIHGQATTFVL